MKTYAYGFPRLGEGREFKASVERYWSGASDEDSFRADIAARQADIAARYRASVDAFPAGEMTRYDNMLDTAVMTGVYRPADNDGYYRLCRGAKPLEMTKWFNTNYHYLIPDLSLISPDDLSLHWNKPMDYAGVFGSDITYLIGPYTFLRLSKGVDVGRFPGFMEALGLMYREILSTQREAHIDEPAFTGDVSPEEVAIIKKTYSVMGTAGAKMHLFTYYDSVDFLADLHDVPFASIGLDCVRGAGNIRTIRESGFPSDRLLVAGLVDGRNVWKNDIAKSVELLGALSSYAKNIAVSNAAPLFHVPVTLRGESLDPALLSRLAFAAEKLDEIRTIGRVFFSEGGYTAPEITTSEEKPDVRKRVAGLVEADFARKTPFAERIKKQNAARPLPAFPTTTIGSFPQTADLRKKRLELRRGTITKGEFDGYIDGKIRELVARQEELGLDVLVHGEFERSDMVEFFAEKLDGIATTASGWILSYGTRVYRPPIIFGDVSRPEPMTLREINFARGLTKKPLKGMLTGPVTILAWSFVREDIPVEQVAFQVALCLRDEIADYEKSGIGIVQVDEPAFREKAPMKRRDWEDYFRWAIRSFRLATAGVKDETQIHTHMCYSRFSEIMDRVRELDFDVISIEASRSRGDIVESFEEAGFDRQIGLGCWDIHSPEIPDRESMRAVVQRALRVIPGENFWINPDCGLKTRGWEESIPSLRLMVEMAKELRG